MEIWLSQVREAMPMIRIVATRPELLPIIASPVVLGFIAALYAIWRTRGLPLADTRIDSCRCRSRIRPIAYLRCVHHRATCAKNDQSLI
jgi:hypothetical protein